MSKLERFTPWKRRMGSEPQMKITERPRLLTADDLVKNARFQFRNQLANGTFSPEQIETFVRERVAGVVVNGVTVVSIDLDHGGKKWIL